MKKEKIKLNISQQKAVNHEIGPLLVVAGAGTGKTRVIAQRIKHFIEDKNINPKEILALTFTEKASGEMLARVDDVMPLGYEEPWINTFHSFADRVLRAEGIEIGLDPSFKILSSPEQWILFRKNLFKFSLNYFRPLGNPTKFISAILKFISRLQDENISTQEFAKFAQEFKGDTEETKRWQELAQVFTDYQALKLENSVLDFGDLIVWLIKLFRDRPNILKKYQNQFKHVMVDEFQDTNHAQYELIKLIAPVNNLKQRSLLVVGDDSQSIYKFRGAAVSNILEFQNDYKDADMVTLLENYRSTQSILDPAYKLIQNNNPDTLETKLGISKELVSKVKGKGIKPQVFLTETAELEVELVVKKILEILANESTFTYKDFAILARANSHLDPFIFALRKYGLPYQLVGNRGLYDREEIRDVLAILRIIVDPNDGICLYRTLNIDSLDIPSEVISAMLTQMRANKVSLWSVVKEKQEVSVEYLVTKIKEFQDLITKLSPSEFVYRVVNDLNYLSSYILDETIENQMCIKNMDLFLNIAKKFEVGFQTDTKERPTVVDFVDYVDLLIDAGDNPAQAELQDFDTINLMTVHASKGLEFPVVFMVNLVSDRFPTRNRSDVIDLPDEIIKEVLPSGDAHLQEERRLFYVGATRAQKYLFMTLAKNYGGVREKRPSGYLEETGLKITELSAEKLKVEKKSQVGLFGMESGFREPKAEKITNFIPKFLSYSQVSTYEDCPLKYKYSYVLNIPQPPSHALTFGNTIHNTLRDYHTKLLFEKVSFNDLLEMYEKNWEGAGYIDEAHRKAQFEKGKEILKKYFEDNSDKQFKTVALEKSFNLWIGGTKFYGRIDRIDELSDGNVEIIDYKTGQAKDQKYVDKDDQVTFYAIGAKEALGYTPEKMSLYFVETGEKITTTRDSSDLAEKKKEVEEVVAEIKSGNFKANPGMQCDWCAYKGICPHAFKK
ncbi:UvrD-helicase domain-containing protein [candidate division WWE3 bacterium]|nr:UvrD-helicase domain-containing protein [candidate division WWE3 bacterium]